MKIIPKSKVNCVIVDRNAPESFFEYLRINDIKYIRSIFLENIIDAVSTHPDMQICKIDEKTFVCEPTLYAYYTEMLKEYNVKIIKGISNVRSTYPYDIAYNVVITENFLMHNTDYTEKEIKNHAVNSGISIYNVKQGYTKCASCVINSNAIITSDVGIHRTCELNGIDCLLIENDEIKLGERNDGFFGGCCGMIDCNKLLVCGNITLHKSYSEILKFTSKYGVNILCSSKDVLTDIGSIIPVL